MPGQIYPAAMIDIRMKWRSVVPGQRLLSQIQIDEGGETKGQIRARKLCAIRLHELGMRGSGIVVEERHVADVDVRIDEPRNEEPLAAVDARGMRAGDQIRGNLRDAPVANHDGSVGDGLRPFGRNERDVFNDDAIAHHLDRKSTRLNSSHVEISYAVFCLKKKKKNTSPMWQTMILINPQ